MSVNQALWDRARERAAEQLPNTQRDSARLFTAATKEYRALGGAYNEKVAEHLFRQYLGEKTAAVTEKVAGERLSFARFLHLAGEREVVEVDDSGLDFADAGIGKYAEGMPVYNPTIDRLQETAKNELVATIKSFPEYVEVDASIFPKKVNKDNKHVEEASGEARLNYEGTVIRIPFMVKDGQILPFDAIQLGDERAVFTRDNLLKVLQGLRAATERKENSGTSPYAGVANRGTSVTDPGFLSELLKFRGSRSVYVYGGGGSQMTPMASDGLVDVALEKAAAIATIRPDRYAAVASVAEQATRAKLAGELVDELADAGFDKHGFTDLAELTKEASDPSAPAAQLPTGVLAEAKVWPWRTLPHLQHGQPIKFLELSGEQYKMTTGRVYKSLQRLDSSMTTPTRLSAGLRRDLHPDQGKLAALIITDDGRILSIRANEPFVAVALEPQEVPAVMGVNKPVPADKLQVGRIYVSVIEGNLLAPFRVEEAKYGGEFNLPVKFAYKCSNQQNGSTSYLSHWPQHADDPKEILQIIPSGELAEAWDATGELQDADYHRFFDGGSYHMIPPTWTFHEIKGRVEGYLTNPTAMVFKRIPQDQLFKQATAGDHIELRVRSAEDPISFDLRLHWLRDNFIGRLPVVGRTFLGQKREFLDINERQVRTILKLAGFEPAEFVRLLERAVVQGSATEPLTPSHTPEKIRPDFVQKQTDHVLTTVKKTVLHPDTAKAYAQGIFGGMLAAAADGTPFAAPIRFLSAIASESHAITEKLEKLAYTRQSEPLAKLAQLMNIKARLDQALLEATGGQAKAGFYDATRAVQALEGTLAATAHNLVLTKVASTVGQAEPLFSPNLVAAMLSQLQGLHAYGRIAQEG